jgi:hypothetical protein
VLDRLTGRSTRDESGIRSQSLATKRDREIAELAKLVGDLDALVAPVPGNRRGPVLDPPAVAALAGAWRGVATWMRALTDALTDEDLSAARNEATTAIAALRTKRSGLKVPQGIDG